MPLTRLTVIAATPLEEGTAAERWLDELAADGEALEDEVRGGLATANSALHAHAVGTHDPRSRRSAGPIRSPFGSATAPGRRSPTGAGRTPWRFRRRNAGPGAPRRSAPPSGSPRSWAATSDPDACETLLLRARADLDAGRDREAALQLQVGLDALLAEVGPDAGADQADDLADLQARRPAIGTASDVALQGEVGAERVAELEATLHVCERVLRRRRILGAGRG